jgi:hypothetical protein
VKTGVVGRPVERGEQCGDPAADGDGNSRQRRAVRAQERVPLAAEALDERLRAQRRFDRRIGGESPRLQRVKDQVIEIPVADAVEVRPVRPLDVRGEAGGRDATGFEPRLQRRRIRPGYADDTRPGMAGRPRQARGGEESNVPRQKTSRNPSWMKRWKFDCAVVLRLIRPKSAELVSRT